jgi:competence protein ComEA
VVHVSGAVAQPGVYELADGARVRDAVEAAGGFLPQADLQKANLAARVQDGERLQVLSLPPTPLPTSPISATAAFVPTSEPEQVETSTPAGPIDINLASLEELDSLPGIGPVLASRIIAYREEHGPFSDPAAIMEVSGIGPAKYADIQNLIAVSGAP